MSELEAVTNESYRLNYEQVHISRLLLIELTEILIIVGVHAVKTS